MSLKKIKYTILLLVITSIQLIAKNEPPTPTGSGAFDDEWQVGAPIDTYSSLLIFLALSFGLYAIAKRKNLSKKSRV